MGGQLEDYLINPPKRYVMEGPDCKLAVFNNEHSLRQIGWLGATGTFYPWPSFPSRQQEPGSYSPVYIEVE